MGVSRQAYYKCRRSSAGRASGEAALLQLVKACRHEQARLGGRKLYHELLTEIRSLGRGFGRDKFFDLLRCHDLLIKRKRRYAITTQSDHAFYKYDNKLKQATIAAPHQAWVSDITYLRTRHGFVYLSLVSDVYSRKIVGWHVDRSLAVEGVLKSLRQAISQSENTDGLIHHSDRGIQYCCRAYTSLLKKKRIQISMGEAGNCYDNAIAERINGILKEEYLLESEFLDITHATQAARQAIYLYNHKRPHWSLNLSKPADVHQAVRKTRAGSTKKQGTASFGRTT